MKKVSGIRVPYLLIIFIIECEGKELVENEIHLLKIEGKKSKVDNFSRINQHDKTGLHFTDRGSIIQF